jgi:hypothetical protein
MVYAADTLLALVRAGVRREPVRTMVRPHQTEDSPVQRPVVAPMRRPLRRPLAAR